jgi:histidinol-phosphate aminotransferase
MPDFQLQSIIRPHLLSLTPYSSARDEYAGRDGVFLDANENALGSTSAQGDFSRYPDPQQSALKARLAPIKGVRPDQIFLGNGSDEPIDLLIRLTCRPGQDAMLIVPPTYGMYEVSANINEVSLIRVPLTADFQLDTDAVIAAITHETKLIWLCSPNNPSGNLLDPAAIRRVIEAAQTSATPASASALVIVDEAYIDFADAPSWTAELDRYPNLVVLQTLSKAWGLAALRLGMAFASAELVGYLNRIKPPYNIPAPTQTLALEALDHETDKSRMVAEIRQERVRLAESLRALPSVRHIYPSDANFLLVRFADARATFAHLIDEQVIVRDRSRVTLCAGCLRITVGTAAENERLLAVLQTES